MRNKKKYEDIFRIVSFTNHHDVFKELFLEFYPSLCVFAGRYITSSETCEDVVQEVFFNIWEKRKSLNIHSSFRNFLITSVKNSCTDYLRKQSSHKKYIENHSLSTASPSPADIYTTSELEQMLQAALYSLPENVHSAFIMSRNQKMTYKEIAAEMNISSKTVESYISQALKVLREELKDYLPIALLFAYFM